MADDPSPSCKGDVSVFFFKAANMFIRSLASLTGDVTLGKYKDDDPIDEDNNDDEGDNDDDEDSNDDDDNNNDDDLVNTSSPKSSRTSSL